MESNANYALVGLAATVLLIGMIAFSVWLAAFKFNQDYDYYDIVFKGPVRGLSQGGEVHFNGIKVGEVTRISLDTVDPTQVIARAKVTSDVPIRVDSYATLEPQGITGVNYVQITAGTPAKRLLKRTVPRGQVPRIRSESEHALRPAGRRRQRPGAGGRGPRPGQPRPVGREHQASQRYAGQTSRPLTAELRDRKSMIADAQRALQGADQAAQRIGELATSGNTLVNGDGRRVMTRLDAAATAIEAAAKDLHTMMGRLEGPTGDFATTGLQQITAASASLQQAADNLDRILGEVQQSPQGLLSRPPAQEIEVKP